MSDYVPDEGDVVWLEFDPQAGHEQAGLAAAGAVGWRPALPGAVAAGDRYSGLVAVA